MLNLVFSKKKYKHITFTDMTERRTELEKSSSQISENEDQITDQEEHDSELSESDVTDTMIEEPQTEVKRIVPVRCALAVKINR